MTLEKLFSKNSVFSATLKSLFFNVPGDFSIVVHHLIIPICPIYGGGGGGGGGGKSSCTVGIDSTAALLLGVSLDHVTATWYC